MGSGSYLLDAARFPDSAQLRDNAALGRLTVPDTLGDIDGDGDFDKIHPFGARSLSIWSGFGTLIPRLRPLTAVWDGGEDLERVTAAALPDFFNSNNDEVGLDDRSDNKGPEPEGLTVATIGGRTFAFSGLERVGGVIAYDVTDPREPRCVAYVTSRDYSEDIAGDSGPEGIEFVAAAHSPIGTPLLLVGNEISKTIAVFDVLPTRESSTCVR